METWFILGLLTLLGLLFGSFANVVIWRFPRGESLSTPPSHCPACDSRIRWRDNVPVVSWLLLRGRCRDCGASISPRYPLVEALSGALWLGCGIQFGLSVRTLFAVVFVYLLLILAFIDWDTFRLPNPIVGALALTGLAGAAVSALSGVPLTPLIPGTGWSAASPLSAAILGAVLGAGVSLGIAMLYSVVRKADGFGMGDVKLLGAMGFFLGPFVLMALFFGSVIGAVYGIAAARARGASLKTKVPFGPFLAMGGLLTLWFGPSVWVWYLGIAFG